MTLAQWKQKYGATGYGFRLVIEEFIKRAPEFKGDKELAAEIAKMVADLESALYTG